MLKKDEENIQNSVFMSWASLVWSACIIAFFITIPVFCASIPYNYYGLAMIFALPAFPITFIGAFMGLYFFKQRKIAIGTAFLSLLVGQTILFGKPIFLAMLADIFYHLFFK